MFVLEDEITLFLYCWTFNKMQIPATRDRSRRRATVHRHARIECRLDLDRPSIQPRVGVRRATMTKHLDPCGRRRRCCRTPRRLLLR